MKDQIIADNQFDTLDRAAGRGIESQAVLGSWEEPVSLSRSRAESIDFPYDVFPAPVQRFAEAVRDTYGASGGMDGVAVLSALSVACRKDVRIQIKSGHLQFANIYCLVAAPVASGKTPVTKAVFKPLTDWEKRKVELWETQFKSWKSEVGVLKFQRKKMEQKLAGKTPTDAETDLRERLREVVSTLDNPPIKPQLIAENFTSEALGQIMSEQGGFIGLVSGEGRQILNIAAGRYNEAGDIDLWLKSHAGDDHRVSRKSTASFEVKEAVMAALLMTQPDSLEMLGRKSNIIGSGFLSRFLFCLPEPCFSGYSAKSIQEKVLRGYDQVISRMLDQEPVTVELEDGFDKWQKFHDKIKKRALEIEDQNPAYASWLCKIPETVARFAGVLYAADRAAEESRSMVDLVEAGIRLFKYFDPHARNAFSIISTDSELSRMQRVWVWIENNREKLTKKRADELGSPIAAVNTRDICNAGVAGLKKARDAQSILRKLEEHKYLRCVETTTIKGNDATVFLVRPSES